MQHVLLVHGVQTRRHLEQSVHAELFGEERPRRLQKLDQILQVAPVHEVLEKPDAPLKEVGVGAAQDTVAVDAAHVGNLAHQRLVLALDRLSERLHHVETLVGQLLGEEEVSIIELEKRTLLDLVIPLRVVFIKDTLNFRTEIALYFTCLAKVVIVLAECDHAAQPSHGSILPEAHHDGLQADEGVAQLLLDGDLLHLQAQLVGKALPKHARPRRLNRLHFDIFELVELVLENEEGITAPWYLFHHVFFGRNFSHDFASAVHGVLKAPGSLDSLLLLDVHVGEHGVPLRNRVCLSLRRGRFPDQGASSL